MVAAEAANVEEVPMLDGAAGFSDAAGRILKVMADAAYYVKNQSAQGWLGKVLAWRDIHYI